MAQATPTATANPQCPAVEGLKPGSSVRRFPLRARANPSAKCARNPVLPFCQNRVTLAAMKGITVKLPETTLRRLRQEARATGRSVAALIRERVDVLPHRDGQSVYELTADLAGCVAGDRKPATNDRRKFVRP